MKQSGENARILNVRLETLSLFVKGLVETGAIDTVYEELSNRGIDEIAIDARLINRIRKHSSDQALVASLISNAKCGCDGPSGPTGPTTPRG